MQADILATFRKKTLQQPSLFSLKHYHRPLVRYACSAGLCDQKRCVSAFPYAGNVKRASTVLHKDCRSSTYLS